MITRFLFLIQIFAIVLFVIQIWVSLFSLKHTVSNHLSTQSSLSVVAFLLWLNTTLRTCFSITNGLKLKESTQITGRQTVLCQAVKTVDLIFPRWTETQSFCLSCNKRSINIPSGALRSGAAFVAHLPWCWGLVGNCADRTTHTAPTRRPHIWGQQWWRPSEAHCQLAHNAINLTLIWHSSYITGSADPQGTLDKSLWWKFAYSCSAVTNMWLKTTIS